MALVEKRDQVADHPLAERLGVDEKGQAGCDFYQIQMHEYETGFADVLRVDGSQDGRVGSLKHFPKLLERLVPDRVSREKQIVLPYCMIHNRSRF